MDNEKMVTKEDFTQYLAEYALKWVVGIRKHLRVHLDEYYENPVIVELIVNWYNYEERARKAAIKEFINADDGNSGQYDHDRAWQYSEILYDILHLRGINS